MKLCQVILSKGRCVSSDVKTREGGGESVGAICSSVVNSIEHGSLVDSRELWTVLVARVAHDWYSFWCEHR